MATMSNQWNNPFFKTHQDLNDEITRIYGENLDAEKRGAQSGSDFLSKDYQNTIDQLNLGLQESTKALSNKSASQGAFGSSAWQEQQAGLANKYNLEAKDKFNTTAYKSENLGLQYQPNIGMGVSSQIPTFTQSQASPTGQVSQGTQSYRYNPFQQAVGGLEAGKNYAAKKIIY